MSMFRRKSNEALLRKTLNEKERKNINEMPLRANSKILNVVFSISVLWLIAISLDVSLNLNFFARQKAKSNLQKTHRFRLSEVKAHQFKQI